jgi:hypothetical protein
MIIWLHTELYLTQVQDKGDRYKVKTKVPSFVLILVTYPTPEEPSEESVLLAHIAPKSIL